MMRFIKYIIFLTIGILTAVLMVLSQTNCSKDTTEPQDFILPDSNLSFTQHIHPLLLSECAASSGCHQSANPAGGLDLETPTPTFNGNHGPAVFPFDADHSPLYRVLLGPYGELPRMPYNRSPLSDAKIKAIKTWINEGANINN